MRNRSVPTDVILPHIVYRNVPDAIAWLAHAFGFVEHYRYGDSPGPIGAQVHLGEAWMMLETAKAGSTTPAQSGLRTQSLTIFVDDVEAHFNNARSAGVTIVEDLPKPSTASCSTQPSTSKAITGSSPSTLATCHPMPGEQR
jgi:uncharacterized glyoxalase superfamily protein PhnB